MYWDINCDLRDREMRFIASKRFMYFIIVLLLLLQQFSSPVIAGVTNDSDLCVYATHKYEKQFNIKPHLLTTISHVETGRFDASKKTSAPWPWTVNANGKGWYLDSKSEAVAKVKSLQKKGIKSIDVGCMQVNLKYHGSAFDSVEDAFDVEQNVYYAASFLSKLYKNADDSWDKATMHYHSKRGTRGLRYKKKIDERLQLVKNIPIDQNMLTFDVKKRERIDAHAWREAKLEKYRQNKLSKQDI